MILGKMFKLIKKFKEASLHTKIFWIVTLSVGIITAVMSLYPYLWFDLHRSGKKEVTK